MRIQVLKCPECSAMIGILFIWGKLKVINNFIATRCYLDIMFFIIFEFCLVCYAKRGYNYNNYGIVR